MPSGSTTVISEKIIKMLAFDATESGGDSNRQSYGNNDWYYSNLRQWANSSATSWYSSTHSYDRAPSSSYVTCNAYDSQAGFLNAWSEDDRSALVDTTRTYAGYSGNKTSSVDKVFLLTSNEVGLETLSSNGTAISYFSSNDQRIAYITAEAVANSDYSSNPSAGAAWYWWLQNSYSSNSYRVRNVYSSGTLNYFNARYGNYGFRPASNLDSGIPVSDVTDGDGCYTVVWNQAPSAPSSITTPEGVVRGAAFDISWGASTDPEGSNITYYLERKLGSNDYTQVYSGAATKYSDTVPYGYTTVQYRVRAADADGAYSDYKTSNSISITQNRAPVISGADADLGTFNMTAPTISYSVTDADNDACTATYKLDGTQIGTASLTLGKSVSYTIPAATWQSVPNGSHELAVVVTDAYSGTATRMYTFTRSTTTVKLQRESAMGADAMPEHGVVSVTGEFPAGCELKVEACNNGFDANPTWQDVTDQSRKGYAFSFENAEKTADKWGVNARVTLERGDAEGTCGIKSISGSFD
jgi:hypothetical protein